MGRKLKSEGALVAWLRRRDELIRADMAARINDLSDELTGAEALAKAMEEHKHLWNMKDEEVAANTSWEIGSTLVEQFTVPMHLETEADSSTNSRKRRRIGQESDVVKAWPRRHPDGRWVTQFKGGGNLPKLCVEFNAGRCTYGNKCKKGLHACGVMMGPSKLCMSKAHGACNHSGR